MTLRMFPSLILAGALILIPASLPAEVSVSFTRDVMPVLSRGGCNTGGCHGHRDGRGDLKLSLWGESPATDYLALTSSPKILDRTNPAGSLLLEKPTLQTDHKGEKRFDHDSPDYGILLQWLESGAPNDSETGPRLESLEVSPGVLTLTEPDRSAQLEVTASFSDGVVRDVTYWAVYTSSNLSVDVEPGGLVRFQKPGETTIIVRYLDQRTSVRLALVPQRPGFSWNGPEEVNYVDRHVFAKLRSLRLNPSARCDDATFVRRVFLDVIGVLPTADEARAFVADTRPDKRVLLVESLLARPEFGEFWALKWSDLLRNEEKVLDPTGVKTFHGWLRDSLAAGMGLDQLARELLTGRGSTYTSPPANYYRALRNPTDRSEATAQVFLGARLRCAKCHNHPFDRWTQDEYYQFAALFDGLDYKIIENKRRDKYDKNQFIGEQEVQLVDKREFVDPRTKKPPVPRLLGAETPDLDPSRDRFEQLADWITSSDNSLFARVQANRIWFNIMGRALVDPVDDFRPTNPPTHPELLDELARDLVANGYDLRHLIRRITSSQTYQLSSLPNASNAEDRKNYARAPMPRLPAEVLLDAIHSSLDVPVRFKKWDSVRRATALPGIEGPFLDRDPHHDDRFLRLFGKPPRLINSDAERLNETSLAQVFELTSGTTLSTLLEAEGNRLDDLLAAGRDDADLLRELYWTTVSRAPTPREEEGMLAHLASKSGRDKRAALQDIAWALVNSKEFMFRH